MPDGCKICNLSKLANICSTIGFVLVCLLLLFFFKWYTSSAQRFAMSAKKTAASISILVSYVSFYHVLVQMNLSWPRAVVEVQHAVYNVFSANILETFGAECFFLDNRIRVAFVSVFLYNFFAIFLFVLFFGSRLIRKTVQVCCPGITIAKESIDKYLNVCSMVFSISAIRMTEYFVADSNFRAGEDGGASAGDVSRVLVGKFFFGIILLKLFREALVLSKLWDGRFLCMKKLALSQERLAKRLNYFSRRFADHAAYYQLVIWLRQFVLLILLQIFDGVALGAVSLAVILLFLFVHYKIQPFEFEFQNRVEACGMWSICVVLAIGILFAAVQPNESIYTEAFAISIIAIVAVSLIFAIIYLRLAESLYYSFLDMIFANTKAAEDSGQYQQLK